MRGNKSVCKTRLVLDCFLYITFSLSLLIFEYVVGGTDG
jgi:hypothetical protein